MFTVTDSALRQLYNTIDQSATAVAGEECFRMVAKEDDTLGLSLEAPAPEDKTFDCEGCTVLAMPETLMEHLSERTLDTDDSGDLVLRPRLS